MHSGLSNEPKDDRTGSASTEPTRATAVLARQGDRMRARSGIQCTQTRERTHRGGYDVCARVVARTCVVACCMRWHACEDFIAPRVLCTAVPAKVHAFIRLTRPTPEDHAPVPCRGCAQPRLPLRPVNGSYGIHSCRCWACLRARCNRHPPRPRLRSTLEWTCCWRRSLKAAWSGCSLLSETNCARLTR